MKADTSRQHLIDGINILSHYTDMRGDLVAVMRKFVQDSQNNASVGEHFWAEVSVFGRMDETWTAGVIHQVSGLSMATLSKIKEWDADAVRHIWCFLHNATMLTVAPPVCVDKRVMKAVSSKRMADVGERHNILKTKGFVSASGQVNWLYGVYELGFDAESTRLVSILHRPTLDKCAIDADVGIDSSFDLLFNWSDTQAELQKGKARRFRLQRFFGRNQGPNKVEQWSGKSKQFLAMAADIAADLERQRPETGSIEAAAAEEFQQHIQATRSAATERARQTLTRRMEETNKKRKVTLTPEKAPQ